MPGTHQFGGMAHVKISQLIVAAGVAAAGLIGFGGSVHAAPPADAAASACVSVGAPLAVTIDPETFEVIAVPAGDTQTVSINAGSQTIVAEAACDTPVCAEGIVTTVVDDNGVQQQACVASAAAVPPAPAVKASLVPPTQPVPNTTAATSDGSRTLPKTGAGTGVLIIAALLVGSGSVVSLLARRRS